MRTINYEFCALFGICSFIDKKKTSGADGKSAGDVFLVVLFINAVDGNFEKSFLSIEFVFSIVFRESDGYIYAVARVMADELFFKVIDVSVGADHKISAVSFCVSTFKFHAVNGADIVDIDGITVLNGEGSVGLQRGRSRSGG